MGPVSVVIHMIKASYFRVDHLEPGSARKKDDQNIHVLCLSLLYIDPHNMSPQSSSQSFLGNNIIILLSQRTMRVTSRYTLI